MALGAGEHRVFPDVNVWINLFVYWCDDFRHPVQVLGAPDWVASPAAAALYPMMEHGNIQLPTGTLLALCTSEQSFEGAKE